MQISTDLLTGLISFLLTLFIFSYLIKDNPLFRLASYLFVGVSAGYIAALAWWQVVWPNLVHPLINAPFSERTILLVPLLASGFLLMKIWPRLGRLGTPVLAFLVGVSAAAAIGGAVSGTLAPQILSVINAFDLRAAAASPMGLLQNLWNAAFIMVGTVTTLAYFHFGARLAPDGSVKRLPLIDGLAFIGRIFIAITLGVIFAGVYLSALTAFIERLDSVLRFFGSL